MTYLNRVQYSGNQTTPDTFAVSVSSGAQAAPDGVLFNAVVEQVSDKSVYMACSGSITAGVFTVNTVYDSSNANVVPAFQGSVNLFSVASASDLNRISTGRAVVFHLGQSNVCGLNSGFQDQDIVYPNNMQWSRSTSAIIPDRISGVEGLEHQFVGVRLNDQISYAIGFGNTLIDNGHKAVLNVPSGADSSGYSTTPDSWLAPSGTWFTGAVSDAIAALNDPLSAGLNYPALIILRLGESDALNSMSQADFRDNTVSMISQFKSQVQAGTGIDMSRVPLVVIGFVNTFYNGGAARQAIEAAMAELPDYIPYCSYLNTRPWSTTDDGTHEDVATVRRISYQELLPKKLEAEANRTPSGSGALSASVSATASTTALIRSSEILLQGAANAVVSASLSSQAVEPIQASVNVSATASAAFAAALPTSLLFKRNVNVVKDGSDEFVSWTADDGITTIDRAADANYHPLVAVGGELVFDSNDNIVVNGVEGILNSADGYTLIFDLNATNANTFQYGSTGFNINKFNTSNQLYVQGTNAGAGYGGVTVQGARKWIAVTLDRTGDFAKVIDNGTDSHTFNTLGAKTDEAQGVTLGIGAAFNGFTGNLFNVYLNNQPMTAAECQTFVTNNFGA